MTTSDDGRGSSVPPRPPAGKPQQWFVLRPWVFDVTMAGVLLRAAPRPHVPIPVDAWARAYGLVREPGGGRRAISLIGPGPDFSRKYAMTTDPGEPVILATLAGPGGEPGGPLLIDGYALPVTVRSEVVRWRISWPGEMALSMPLRSMVSQLVDCSLAWEGGPAARRTCCCQGSRQPQSRWTGQPPS